MYASKVWYENEPNYEELRKYFEQYAEDHDVELDNKTRDHLH